MIDFGLDTESRLKSVFNSCASLLLSALGTLLIGKFSLGTDCTVSLGG